MSKITPFKTATSYQSGNYPKSLLSRHFILPKWNSSKINPGKTIISSQNENCNYVNDIGTLYLHICHLICAWVTVSHFMKGWTYGPCSRGGNLILQTMITQRGDPLWKCKGCQIQFDRPSSLGWDSSTGRSDCKHHARGLLSYCRGWCGKEN